MLGRVVRIVAVLAVAAGTLLPAATAQATAPPNHQVTICHRTGSTDGGNQHNGYDIITVDIASSGFVVGGHDHHEQVGNGPSGDLIPAYDYVRADGTVFQYPGKNLTAVIGGATGAAILANGCQVPPRVFAFRSDASSDCRRADGHVIVKATFTNLSTFAVDVTVTEITFTQQSQTMTVAPAEQVLFQFDVGPGPKTTGFVEYSLGWTDGFPGTRTFTKNHSATPACGPTVSTVMSDATATTNDASSTSTTTIPTAVASPTP
jgi:hypothetical protein